MSMALTRTVVITYLSILLSQELLSSESELKDIQTNNTEFQ